LQLLGLTIAGAGDQLLLAAPFADQFKGAVYVFAKVGDTWTEKQRLSVESKGQNAFGMAMAASATMAVIGAPSADFGEGLAHVFGRESGGEWRFVGKLIDKPYSLPVITGGS
jgi:hypothetical protein